MASYNSSDGGVFDKGPQMGMEIVAPRPQSSDDEEYAGEIYHESLKGHTKNDKADMSRMGKVQELRV